MKWRVAVVSMFIMVVSSESLRLAVTRECHSWSDAYQPQAAWECTESRVGHQEAFALPLSTKLHRNWCFKSERRTRGERACCYSICYNEGYDSYMNIYFATIFVNWDRVKTPDYEVVYNAAVLSLFSFHSETGRRGMFMPESRQIEPRPFCLPA